MTEKFQKNIQDWVSIDNKIKNLALALHLEISTHNNLL